MKIKLLIPIITLFLLTACNNGKNDYRKGLSYYENEHYNQVIELFESAINQKYSNSDLYAKLTYSYYMVGDYEKALACEEPFIASFSTSRQGRKLNSNNIEAIDLFSKTLGYIWFERLEKDTTNLEACNNVIRYFGDAIDISGDQDGISGKIKRAEELKNLIQSEQENH